MFTTTAGERKSATEGSIGDAAIILHRSYNWTRDEIFRGRLKGRRGENGRFVVDLASAHRLARQLRDEAAALAAVKRG